MPHRVLITGSTGAMGRIIAQTLRQRGHFVRGLARREDAISHEQVHGDISDRDAVDRAVADMDTVIHLAAAVDDAPFIEELLEPNVVGLFHVADASRKLGVKRLILSSTLQVVQPMRQPRPVRVADGVCPNNHYALTKVWAEQLGEMYARKYEMQVLAVRIGWLPRDAPGAARLEKMGGQRWYLSHDDCARFYTHAVEATLPQPFAVMFALSRNRDEPGADLTEARETIGYEPRDNFPQGLSFAYP